MVLPTQSLWALSLNIFLVLSFKAAASPTYRRSHSFYLVGDIRFEHSSSSNNAARGSRHRTVVERTQQLHRTPWPKGRVPYTMPKDCPEWVKDLIRLAMAEVERQVSMSHTGNEQLLEQLPAPCVKFIPRSSEEHYLEVRDEGSCHATVGYSTSTRPILSVSPFCARLGAIQHQLLHVLGFSHEQARPDRDLYLLVNHTNMAQPAEFLLQQGASHLHDLDLPYDFESLLHFGPYTGAKDPRFPVIIPRPEFASEVKLGQAHALSRTDVLRVQRVYGCAEHTAAPRLKHTSPIRNMLFECDFQRGLCGMTRRNPVRGFQSAKYIALSRGTSSGKDDNSANQDVSTDERQTESHHTGVLHWAVISGLTPDGPAAGRTNGADPYLYASPRLAGWAADGSVTVLESATQTQSGGKTRGIQLTDTESRHAGQRRASEDGLSAEVASLLLAAGGEGVPKVRASVFTPAFSPTHPGGQFCVDFQLFQTDNYGGLTVLLHSASSEDGKFDEEDKGEVVEQLEGIALDGWTWAGFTVQGQMGRRYTLEMRAVVGGGSVALDDLYVIDGECL